MRLENAHDIVDRLSLIKDDGAIYRFRKASRLVDIGHPAVYEVLKEQGYKDMTEMEIAGIGAHAMRQAGSEREFADYVLPGFAHGIGLLGDEWCVGLNDGPVPYWTNPEHRYQPGEMVICAAQY